jgi:hypothetical protein
VTETATADDVFHHSPRPPVGSIHLTEGLRPSDSPTRALARRYAGALRPRGSLAVLARALESPSGYAIASNRFYRSRYVDLLHAPAGEIVEPPVELLESNLELVLVEKFLLEGQDMWRNEGHDRPFNR